MEKRFFRHSALLGLALLAVVEPAQAAEVRGFGINRYEPSEAGSRFFGLESLDHEGKRRLVLRLTGDHVREPQWLYATDGSHRALVDYQFAIHANAALVFADDYRLAVSLPLYLLQSGSTIERFDGTYVGPDSAGIGDVRVALDARLLGEPNGPLRLGLGFRFWAPTGSAEDYTGDGEYKLEPRIDVAGSVSSIEYAARVGYLHRGRRQSFALTPIGDELTFGAGIGLRFLDDALILGPELQTSWALSDTGEIPDETRVLGALLIGGHYRLGNWELGLAAGPGLSHVAGTPRVRALASVQWAPR